MNKDNIKTEIMVKEQKVSVIRINNKEYISLTDLAKYANKEDPSGVIRNWMSNKNSFEFYSLWEEINNPSFNSVESHIIKNEEVPYNRFTMTPKRWKEKFNAIGIIPSSGKYSQGTFAHADIAFEFASWLSPEFKLYLITEFERLKKNEAYQNKIDWHANRVLTKVSYVVHTEWKENNPEIANKGNIRDYTDLLHLVILNNLENINAELIEMEIPQSERLIKLNNMAKKQMELLKKNKSFNNLESIENRVNNNLIDSK